MNNAHALEPSPIQQARQERLFCLDTLVLQQPESARITAKVEAQATSPLTYWQSLALRTAKEERRNRQMEVLAKNFERRQVALMAE